MKILVTGANGFLGQRVVEHALRSGHSVRALVRPMTNIDHLGWSDDVDVFRADLRGGTALEPAFSDVDVLIHLAAGMNGTDEQRFQSTVAATERLLAAMEHSETRRLVLASSFYVYDWKRASRVLNENSPVIDDPEVRDGYTVAKIWQERVVRRNAERHDWELVVMRPGFIWGRSAELPPRIGQSLGRHLAVVGPRSDGALTHVDNCARYFVQAAEQTDLKAETFNIFDGHNVSNWKFAGHYMQQQTSGGWRIPLPYLAGYMTSLAAKLVSHILFGPTGKLPSLVTPLLYQARFRPLRFSTDRLQTAFGKPALNFEQRLNATFDAPKQSMTNVGVSDDTPDEGSPVVSAMSACSAS